MGGQSTLIRGASTILSSIYVFRLLLYSFILSLFLFESIKYKVEEGLDQEFLPVDYRISLLFALYI